MENDDLLTMGVFLIFIFIFIVWMILKKRLGERRTYQLLYIIAVPIVIIYLFIEKSIIISLFSEPIITILFVLSILIFGIILWIYAIKNFFDI